MPLAAPVWAPVQVTGRGDAEIARVAGLQRGFVTREQLLAAGLRRGAITHRLEHGRLHRYHVGIYQVGHCALDPLGREMAAVLHFAGHAVLSHASAAIVWGLLDAPADVIALTVAGRSYHSRSGLRVHRVRTLDTLDLRVCERLPLTSPARTLVDLATELSDMSLHDALAKARGRLRVHDDEIRAALARAAHRTGSGRLLSVLEGDRRSSFTRSEAERRMLELVQAAELPRPLVNASLLGYAVDFLWPAQQVVAEFDGASYHVGDLAFKRDRRRDQRLVAAGFLPIRVTWEDLTAGRLPFVARLAQGLVRGSMR